MTLRLSMCTNFFHDTFLLDLQHRDMRIRIRDVVLNERDENMLGRFGTFNFGTKEGSHQRVVVKRLNMNHVVDREKREAREEQVSILPHASKYFLKIIFNHQDLVLETYNAVYEHYDFNLASLRKLEPLRINIKPILSDVLKGLAFLHSHNMVHRYISPDSVVVCYINHEYVGKIADISMAKSILNNGKNVATSGNFEDNDYSAPELISNGRRRTSGRRMMNNKADVHSVGSTAFNAVTSEHLFENGLRTIPENICNPRFIKNFDVLSYSDYLKAHELKPFEDLVDSLTKSNSNDRPSAILALKSPYFWEDEHIKRFFIITYEFISSDESKINKLNLELNTMYNSWKGIVKELITVECIDSSLYSCDSFGLLAFTAFIVSIHIVNIIELFLRYVVLLLD